ncbi:hypothetical protein HMPREF3156_02775 [Neisseria sp. HMSC06F02]|nr:hypothetical protein HMPREF3156_02775 [Neisseria sp. HMSC06F02]
MGRGLLSKHIRFRKHSLNTKRGGSFSDDLAAYPTIFCGKIGFVPHR